MREKRVWYWLCAGMGWGLEGEGRGELVFLLEMCNPGLSCCHSTSPVRPTLNRGMMKGDFLLGLLWQMQFRPSHLLCHTVPSVVLIITACTAPLGLLRELWVIMGSHETSYRVLRPSSSASFVSFTQQVMTFRVRLSMSRVLPKEIDHVELMF